MKGDPDLRQSLIEAIADMSRDELINCLAEIDSGKMLHEIAQGMMRDLQARGYNVSFEWSEAKLQPVVDDVRCAVARILGVPQRRKGK